MVADGQQGSQLPLQGVRITNGKRHLVIEGIVAVHCHKIDLERIDLSDIHVITAPQQFQINNIFQNMPGIGIAFAKQHKSHTDIYDIVFSQGFQILLTLDIIPLCGIDNVAFDQRIKIAFDGLYINFSPFGCQGVCNFLGGKRTADVVKNIAQHTFQHQRIEDLSSCQNIFYDDRVENAIQVIPNLVRMPLKFQRIGKGTVFQIFGIFYSAIFHTAGTLHIFLKRKRQHFDLHIAPGNKGGYFTGQHIGIGTCDVYIYIFLDIQAVDHFRKIRDVLYLIQKNVSHLFGNKTVFQVSVQFSIVGKFLKIHILKIDGNNLVLFDAILQQPILVHFHQNRFSAAADTCYDFDELLVLKRNQFIQVFSSGNSHNKTSAAFNDSIRQKV